MGEVALAALLCGFLSGGEVEARVGFLNVGQHRHVRVDCETSTHVIEMGLDGKASSRDSVHQAVFAAQISGKAPAVIVIDTDGTEDRYEQEIRVVAEALGIAYATCHADFIVAWAASSGLRPPTLVNDLPPPGATARACDLSDIFSEIPKS